MRFPIVALSIFLIGSASAETPPPLAWKTTNAEAGYASQGEGDPFSREGAQLNARSERDTADQPGGISGQIDAAPWHNRRLVLSARLSAAADTQDTTLWLRADGPDGKLELVNSAPRPIIGGQAPALREIALTVPPQAIRLSFGVVFKGQGSVQADALRLYADTTRTASAAEVLDAAITLVRENALNTEAIAWNEVTPRLRAAVREAKSPGEAHAPVRELLALLGDNHSRLITRGAQQPVSAGRASEKPVVELLPDGIGYVRVPGFSSGERAEAQRFSADIAEGIARIADNATTGWIVDLRRNSGGNMWPMLAGLRPLLGRQELGGFRTRQGQVQRWQAPPADTATDLPDLQRARVAVLQGAATSSSGEIVAVAFRGRADTRSFGQPSDGRTSSNRSYPLPDGSLLALTTARILDRNGNLMPAQLLPDEAAAADANGDPALVAAKAWLIETR